VAYLLHRSLISLSVAPPLAAPPLFRKGWHSFKEVGGETSSLRPDCTFTCRLMTFGIPRKVSGCDAMSTCGRKLDSTHGPVKVVRSLPR